MRRNDTTATGGSINGIASRLKHVALKVGDDPARVRNSIEAEITSLRRELDGLEAGRRSAPDATDSYDEARAIAMQLERLIPDIGQRAEFETDMAAVADALPLLYPALCKVMAADGVLAGGRAELQPGQPRE